MVFFYYFSTVTFGIWLLGFVPVYSRGIPHYEFTKFLLFLHWNSSKYYKAEYLQSSFYFYPWTKISWLCIEATNRWSSRLAGNYNLSFNKQGTFLFEVVDMYELINGKLVEFVCATLDVCKKIWKISCGLLGDWSSSGRRNQD